MINGYSTLGAVALRLIEDYNNPRPLRELDRWGQGDGLSDDELYADFPRPRMRLDSRYTLDQAIEKVCHRKESFASANSSPSYLWGWFDLDHGEATFTLDKTLLRTIWPKGGGSAKRYVAVSEGDVGMDELLSEFIPERNWDAPRDKIGKVERLMVEMGVEFHQKMLFRFIEHWWSTGPDSDPDRYTELLYVEPAKSNVVMIPMTHSLRVERPHGTSFSAL